MRACVCTCPEDMQTELISLVAAEHPEAVTEATTPPFTLCTMSTDRVTIAHVASGWIGRGYSSIVEEYICLRTGRKCLESELTFANDTINMLINDLNERDSMVAKLTTSNESLHSTIANMHICAAETDKLIEGFQSNINSKDGLIRLLRLEIDTLKTNIETDQRQIIRLTEDRQLLQKSIGVRADVAREPSRDNREIGKNSNGNAAAPMWGSCIDEITRFDISRLKPRGDRPARGRKRAEVVCDDKY